MSNGIFKIFKNKKLYFIKLYSWIKIESCNVYFVQTLDNETLLIPDDSTSVTDSMELAEEALKASTKINLKPIMKYIFKDNKLEDLIKKQDAKLESEISIG